MISAAAMVAEAGHRDADWPDEVPFLANLERLVDDCRSAANLNPTGRMVLHKTAVRHLRNLGALHRVTDPPGGPVTRPLVVTGLPRTGTTLLHHLLALDPAHRALRLWEALDPAGVADGASRRAAAQRWVDGFSRLVPDFRAIHAPTVDGPEECDLLLQNTFASQHFDDMFDAPHYSAWLAGADLTAEYAHYAFQLRALGTGPGTTWALKSPSHLGHLDTLIAALPGATVVVCHRDPRQAVASYASLIATLRRAYSDDVSPERIGHQALDRASAAMGRALDARRRAGEASFVDVAYDDLVADPRQALRSLYVQLGRPMAAAVEDAIGAWAAANPRHRHGEHRYDLARFGLVAADVDAAFAAYMGRFGPLAGG